MFSPKELETYRFYLEDLVSISHAAKLKNLNESSLRKAIKTKRLLIHKKVGSAHLCSLQEVMSLTIVGHRPRKERDIFCHQEESC